MYVSKCISNKLDQVHLQGATAVVWRYSGNGGGQGDGEYTITASEYNRVKPVQIYRVEMGSYIDT